MLKKYDNLLLHFFPNMLINQNTMIINGLILLEKKKYVYLHP